MGVRWDLSILLDLFSALDRNESLFLHFHGVLNTLTADKSPSYPLFGRSYSPLYKTMRATSGILLAKQNSYLW